MPAPSPSPQPLVAYVCTQEGADVAQELVSLSGGDGSALKGGGLSGAARLTTDAALARTVLTEIGNISIDMACDCVTEIARTGAEVIVLGRATDIATYRALRQAGALEYFPMPVTAAEIAEVRRRTPANSPAPVTTEAVSSGRVVGVVGSNGGVGASLLAQNLAFAATAGTVGRGRTALIDADLRFGTQALDLDCEETAGLADALSGLDRVDETFLLATMGALREGLSLYAQQMQDPETTSAYEASLAGLTAPLAQSFGQVIYDLPRALLLDLPDMARRLDTLIMVIPAGFPGVNAATRLMGAVRGHAPDLMILPVLTQLRRDAALPAKDIAGAIGLPIAATLPLADAAVIKSRRTARPLVEMQPKGAYAKAVTALARTAFGETASKNAAKGLRRLFS
ncbi:MAG: hypothetical protein P1U53_00740 [Sulfitobacter sp.]|nr:hypothetical protein [Sulfitobacter sp.]